MSRLITAITLLPTDKHSPVAVDGGQLAVLSGLFVLGCVSRSKTVQRITVLLFSFAQRRK